MSKAPLIYRGLRFERTASSAFKDYRYGAAIERPLPSFWRRVVMWIRGEK